MRESLGNFITLDAFAGWKWFLPLHRTSTGAGITLLSGRKWYETVEGVWRNVDGRVKLQNGTEWLWDYCRHAARGNELNAQHQFVRDKRNLCADRRAEFEALAEGEEGEHPFPGIAGFIVSHLCAGNDTLVQDFIPH